MTGTYQAWMYAGRHAHPSMGQPEPGVSFGDEAGLVYRLVSARMRLFTMYQTDETWRRRATDPLAPHGLALFYLEPDGVAKREERVRAGARMFREAEYVGDAVSVLHRLARVVRTYRGDGVFDPRREMCTSQDPMSTRAGYMGASVSTLDVAPDSRWSDVRLLHDGAVVRTRVLVLLVDGTMMQIERSQQGFMTDFRVLSSVPGDEWSIGSTGRRWAPELPELADPNTSEVWKALAGLHRLIAESHHGR